VPTGTLSSVPRKAVSLWRRISSITGAGLGVKVKAVPVAGVRVTDKTVTLKESREGLAGGVSETRVRLTVAVPPGGFVPPLKGPLQAARDKTESRRTGRNERVLPRFMWPPTTE
jgi:hypothetical protein